MIPEFVGLALAVLAALSLLASGILAMLIGRTLATPAADPELAGVDPYAHDGDGMHGSWSLDAAPNFTRATAPFAVLLVGILATGLTTWWLLAAL